MNNPVRLFIGGLDYETTVSGLKAFIQAKGYEPIDVHIVLDHETGRSKGFGFITLPGTESQAAAIEALNGSELGGRILTVSKALPKAGKK